MTTITYRPVSEVDFTAFTAAFNLAYREYYVPISMSPASFRALIDREDIILDLSVAALSGNDIIGMGMLGVRGPHGWIGGVGVIPEFRRRGIGRTVMKRLIDHARAQALETVTLEVIEMNTGAHTLYRQVGFTNHRYLLILERQPALPQHPPTRYVIQPCSPQDLLTLYTHFHSSPSSWQRAYPSLMKMSQYMDGWAAFDQNRIVGYTVGWASQFDVRLVDIAVDPHHNRPAVTHALLSTLHQQYPRARGECFNIHEQDPMLPGFEAAGYTIDFRQIEMALTLQKPEEEG